MACLCCGGSNEVGVLCRACAKEVPPCDGLIPDHIRSTVTSVDAEAWLVDGHGFAHAVAPRTMMGRNQDGQLVVLAASVSREHAELRQSESGWSLRDARSRNGTFVDGVRVQNRITLDRRSIIKLGDVAMWFLPEVIEDPPPPPTLETGAAGGIVRYLLAPESIELLLVVDLHNVASGGTLLSRGVGDRDWTQRPQRELSALEYQLLRTLCTRAVEEGSSPAAVRGCVATKQLGRDLPFHSTLADEENVRQVVRRLRAALTDVGAGGILAVVPGRGYYLACPVSVARA
ncbi:MAG: FHA domain-containing protein [Kofleriaceae bacterium]